MGTKWLPREIAEWIAEVVRNRTLSERPDAWRQECTKCGCCNTSVVSSCGISWFAAWSSVNTSVVRGRAWKGRRGGANTSRSLRRKLKMIGVKHDGSIPTPVDRSQGEYCRREGSMCACSGRSRSDRTTERSDLSRSAINLVGTHARYSRT